jgi:hypothetical protein
VTDKIKKSFLIKFLKVMGCIAGILFLLLITLILLVRLPSVQNKLTQKAIGFVEEKVGTKIQLQNIYISFPKEIVLKGVFMKIRPEIHCSVQAGGLRCRRSVVR